MHNVENVSIDYDHTSMYESFTNERKDSELFFRLGTRFFLLHSIQWSSRQRNFLLRGTGDPFLGSRLHLICDETRAETRFRLSPKRTSPFKSAGTSVQSTTSSRGVRISGSNVGYTMFRGSVRVLVTHSIRHFPLHFPSRASPCATRFQTHSTAAGA